MRHKYETRGIVLSRSSVGEASSFVILLTPELGLVRALAQSVRSTGAKLAHALTTFSESEVVLVRGKDGWRLSGAVLEENWFKKIGDADRRRRSARVSGLLLRLVAGETNEVGLYEIMKNFFEALSIQPARPFGRPDAGDEGEGLEILTDIKILASLGLDAGEIPSLSEISKDRSSYISRINRGIEASGL